MQQVNPARPDRWTYLTTPFHHLEVLNTQSRIILQLMPTRWAMQLLRALGKAKDRSSVELAIQCQRIRMFPKATNQHRATCPKTRIRQTHFEQISSYLHEVIYPLVTTRETISDLVPPRHQRLRSCSLKQNLFPDRVLTISTSPATQCFAGEVDCKILETGRSTLVLLLSSYYLLHYSLPSRKLPLCSKIRLPINNLYRAPFLWHNVSPAIPIFFAYFLFTCISSLIHASVTNPGVSQTNSCYRS